MSKFVCLLVILAVIEASYALQCYKCGGSSASGTPIVACKEKESENILNTCAPKPGFEAYCSKIVVAGKVEKGCAELPKGTKTECMEKNNVKTCICQGDKCNSAPTIGISFFVVAGILARLMFL